MLYHYYIIIVTLKNNNNLINLIKTSTDAWSYFLAMNCQAAYAALMSPLKAEVLQQVPTCAAEEFLKKKKSLFSTWSPWIPGCFI